MFNFNLIKKVKRTFFPFYKNRELKYVFKKLQEGFPNKTKTARFVGGCVRKHLSNEDIDDIDIATSITTDEIKEKFKNTKFKIIDSGIKHGTVTLVSDNLKLELTTLRKDIKTDGRHAEIEYTNDWQEDSKRRDFTINAIYLDIYGKIFDPQSGLADLKNNNIKFIDDPFKRIEEDYLRIIRFIRFSLEYECEAEQTTIEAIKLSLNGIKKISKERILLELFKILRLKNFVKLKNFKDLKEIFLLIFPELKFMKRLDKLSEIPDQFKLNEKILLSILLIDKTNNFEYFSHKYNISNELKENLNLLAKNFINSSENKEFFQNDLKRNVFYFGKEHVTILNVLNCLDNKKIEPQNYLNIFNAIKKLSLPKFPFDGEYLKNKGVKEGAIMGKILKMLEDEWIKNDFNISDQEILKIIKESGN
jgi:tRNA nucleotidyltransferase/poly(A) polymerase